MAVAVIALMTTDASAAGRRRCPCGYAAATAVTTTAMVPAPAPAMAQSPAAGTTQAFSYEPGPSTPAAVVTTPAYVAPVRMRPLYEPGRPDNKARGIYPGVYPVR